MYRNIKKINILKKELLHMPDGSLHIRHRNSYSIFTQYFFRGNERNINKDHELIHLLARKKYLTRLIPFLEAEEEYSVPSSGSEVLYRRVNDVLNDFKSAGLEIARITMTPKQYRWMHGNFTSNPSHPEDLKFTTPSGILVRSKSERFIGERYEFIGAPYRYEMPFTINVSQLVSYMTNFFSDFLKGRPLCFRDQYGFCVWNVPNEFSWMNSPGSVWRLFDSKTGTITIYPDFTTLTADNELIIHEHEGLCDNPRYRCNASERIFLLRHSGAVSDENLILTFENDLEDINTLTDMLNRRIRPRI